MRTSVGESTGRLAGEVAACHLHFVEWDRYGRFVGDATARMARR